MFIHNLLGGFGFQAYSNINPFDIVKSVQPIITETNTPRSLNPFSTPSPVQNPFMSFIDGSKATNPWAVVSGTTSSSFGSFSPRNDTTKTESFATTTTTTTTTEIPKTFPTTSSSSNTSGPIKDIDNNDNNDNDEDDDGDIDDDEINTGVYGKIYQLPENVPVITGEENEECLLLVRAKLYKLQTRLEKESTTSTDEVNSADWVEVGVGPVKILRNRPYDDNSNSNGNASTSSQESVSDERKTGKTGRSHRLVMRRESSRGGSGNYI